MHTLSLHSIVFNLFEYAWIFLHEALYCYILSRIHKYAFVLECLHNECSSMIMNDVKVNLKEFASHEVLVCHYVHKMPPHLSFTIKCFVVSGTLTSDCPNFNPPAQFHHFDFIPAHSTQYNFISSIFTSDTVILYELHSPYIYCVCMYL